MKSTPEQLEYWKRYRRANREKYRAYYQTVKEKKKQQLKTWCSKNKDKRRAASQRFYRNHVEQRALEHKIYNKTHRESIAKQQKQYRAANSEKIKAYMQKYHKSRYSNPDIRAKLIAQTIAYGKANPEVKRKSYRAWCARNPQKVKAHNHFKNNLRRARKRGSSVNPKSIQIFLSGVKSKTRFTCYYCERSFGTKIVHIDHIVPLSKGGAHSVENLCTACPPCNLSKSAKLLTDFITLGQQLLEL